MNNECIFVKLRSRSKSGQRKEDQSQVFKLSDGLGRVSSSQELSRLVTVRYTSLNLLLRDQNSKVIPSLFELDPNASQTCDVSS